MTYSSMPALGKFGYFLIYLKKYVSTKNMWTLCEIEDTSTNQEREIRFM